MSEPLPRGVVASFSVWAHNSTADALDRLLKLVRDNIINSLGNDAPLIMLSIKELSLTPNYTAFFNSMNSSPSPAASISLSSSRLLGLSGLSNRDPAEVAPDLRKIMARMWKDLDRSSQLVSKAGWGQETFLSRGQALLFLYGAKHIYM
ncbi:hypothetical protein GGS26DRAFT_524429 [Hypomontagnella submonticulosa]|nr:hypothetical protein GGS26DRAFT_524429 [Hypomontagnella submonticulosa]